jgi:hypothetical protein
MILTVVNVSAIDWRIIRVRDCSSRKARRMTRSTPIGRRRLADGQGRGRDDDTRGQFGIGRRHSGQGGPCGNQRCVDGLGASAQTSCAACRPAVADRPCVILDDGRTEAAEPGSAPTGESNRSAQRRQGSKSPRLHHPSPFSPVQGRPIFGRRIPPAKYNANSWLMSAQAPLSFLFRNVLPKHNGGSRRGTRCNGRGWHAGRRRKQTIAIRSVTRCSAFSRDACPLRRGGVRRQRRG